MGERTEMEILHDSIQDLAEEALGIKQNAMSLFGKNYINDKHRQECWSIALSMMEIYHAIRSAEDVSEDEFREMQAGVNKSATRIEFFMRIYRKDEERYMK